MLYLSGQMPIASDGTVPKDFRDQPQLAWANIEAQLRAADMRLSNIVKHTTFLSNRRYCEANSEVRRKVLGDHEAAPAVIIVDIPREAQLLKIEAVAAA